MTTQQIVLQGPGPWGFRLVGGKDFEQPLAISRVRAAWDAWGAGRSGAGERRGPEETWGGWAPRALSETAVSGAGVRAGTAGRIQVRQEQRVLSAFRAPRARSPFPDGALGSKPGGSRSRTYGVRGKEVGNFRSFAREARPGVWTRFVK